MMRAWLVALTVAVVVLGRFDVRAEGPGVWEHMAMLEGHWRQTNGTAVVDEVWLSNKGNVITGMTRWVDGLSNSFEFSRIENRKAGIVMIVQRENEPEVTFRLMAFDARSVVFENAVNGWPQRIEYRRTGVDTLEAKVGPITGNGKTLMFKYVRVR